MQNGLLGGGLADGSVCIWNPAQIIGRSSPGTGNPMLARLQKHQGAVRGLEFNPFAANLLASGAADGELCIWDVGNPSQPSLYPAMKGGTMGNPASEITCLSWNRKVQHILSTTTASGNVVVWDLKKQRPVITLKDPGGRRRCSAVAWNPDVATQLAVASDDDSSPSIQLWDLRNSVSPFLELHGHAKGVLGLSWCPQDASFLLTSGKDNRCIVWDVPSGQIHSELPPTSANWRFDVQWAPGKQPGLFAGATFEGLVSVHSLASCQPGVVVDPYGNQTLSAASSKAPSWSRCPASASFGFGGKLATILNSRRQLPTGESVTTGTVYIKQLAADEDTVDISPEFENVIRSANKDTLRNYCITRAANASNQQEAETWEFLQTHFEADGKEHLLVKLGFGDALPKLEETVNAEQNESSASAFHASNEPQVQSQNGVTKSGVEFNAEMDPSSFEKLSIQSEQSGHPASHGYSHFDANRNHQLAQQLMASEASGGALDDGSGFFSQSPVDGSSFFDSLNSPQKGLSPVTSADTTKNPQSFTVKDAVPKSSQQNAESPGAGGKIDRVVIVDGTPGKNEDEINAAMLVGNYAGAVEACLKVERYADALIAASLVGGEIWDKAREKYMQAHPRPFMRVVHAALSGNWKEFVTSRPVGSWKSTLAALLTSAPYHEFEELAGILAKKLEDSGAEHSGILCFICAGDVPAAVAAWNKFVGQNPSVDARQSVMEKAVILGLGVDRAGSSAALGDLLAKQAETLAANGKLSAAYSLLTLVPEDSTSESVAVLRDRISQSGALLTKKEQVPGAFGVTPDYDTGANIAAKTPSYQTGPAVPPQPYPSAPQQAHAPSQYSAYTEPTQQWQSQPGMISSVPTQPSQFASFPPSAVPSAAVTEGAPGDQTGPQPAFFQPQPLQPAVQSSAPPQAPPTTFQQPQYQVPGAASSIQPHQHGYESASGALSTSGSLPQQSPQKNQPPSVFQPASMSSVGGIAAPPLSAPNPPSSFQQPHTPSSPGFKSYGSNTTASGRTDTTVAPVVSNNTFSGGMTATFSGGLSSSQSSGMQGGALNVPSKTSPPAASPSVPPANTTLMTSDTSSVPGELRGAVNSLIQLYQSCQAIVGGQPIKKRELDDASKKLGALVWRINAGLVSTSVSEKLQQLGSALDAGDFATAGHIQVMLTTSDWDECAGWLTALKRLLKLRQTVG